MPIEIIQKIAAIKTSALPLLMLTVLKLPQILNRKKDLDGYDDALGDNFPYVIMSHGGKFSC